MPSASEIASRLADGPVCVAGSGSRPWGRDVDAPVLETASVKGLEHEPGDFTAVIGAGVTLRDAQAAFAAEGQMLGLDPPGGGTVGGLFATADSGPLRHRYGAPRDLIIGVEMALADGTVARGGGRVIKNVAGYDLPKLATGSFGTLGVITEVAVRLHPRPEVWATAAIAHEDTESLMKDALRLARMPLEAEALDFRWDGERGSLLVRFAGSAAADRAAAVAGEVIEGEDEAALWAEQRGRQRGDLVIRVHALPTELASVLLALPGASAVGRAGVGTIWLQPPVDSDPAAVRRALAPLTAAVLDAPEAQRRSDPFFLGARPELNLMKSVKYRFDPDHHCNPGRLWP